MEANLYLVGVPIGMMQRDAVLASQHFGPRRTQASEQRLMIGVLHDALDYVARCRLVTNNRGITANPDVPLVGSDRAVARLGGYQR